MLDRGGLPAILETLNDGQPKLQQAYLTIIALLFASPTALAQHINKTNSLVPVSGISGGETSVTDAPFGRGSNKAPGECCILILRGLLFLWVLGAWVDT